MIINNEFNLKEYSDKLDILQMMTNIVVLRDEDRLLSIGYIIHSLVNGSYKISFSSEYKEAPPGLDLFLLSLYPYIYPRIEEWEELNIENNPSSYEAKIQKEENDFLLKISITQAKVISKFINYIFKCYSGYIVDENFDVAVKLYWEERSKQELK